MNSDNNPEDTSRENRYDYSEKTKDKDGNKMTVSKFRIVASQSIGTLAVNLLKTACGCTTGFTTIFLGELAKENPDISVTFSELTWYSSYFFMLPVGSLLGGFVAQYIGTRLLLIISSLMFIFSWLLYHWSTSSEMILCAQAIIGLASGIGRSPSLAYIAEITQPHLRGTFMISATLFYTFGQFFPVLLKGYLHWRTIVLVNLIFPIVALLIWFILPNSPHWLASKNRINDSQHSLAWFRGWTSSDCIKSEMQTLENNWNNRVNSSTSTLNNENVDNFTTITKFKNTIKPYLHRTFCIPLAIICYIFSISIFGGSHSVQVYSEVLFTQIRSPLEAHTATLILNILRIIAVIICLSTIHLVGKRKLTFFSIVGGGIFFAIAAIFSFLIESNRIVSTEYLWVPTISIILAVFVLSTGIEKCMHLLNCELFPLSHRLIGSGCGETFYQLFLAAFSKSFYYLANFIQLSGMLTLFAAINIIGFIILYFVLPETEGRTLNEIEEHFAGVRNLKKKPNKDSDLTVI